MGAHVDKSSTRVAMNLNAPQKMIQVLHVDDELGFLKVAKNCLEAQGDFKVDAAASVEEALEKMRKKAFDVIVCDYQIRGKDGLQFLRELRSERNDIPFIMFTGKGREEVAIEALNWGADQYFNKFGDPATVYGELTHGIKKAVERKSMYIELWRKEEKLRAYSRHLEETHEFLKNVFAASPDSIIVTDLEHNIVECNEATLGLYEWASRDELVGRNIIDLITERDHRKAIEDLKRTPKLGSVRNIEYTMQTKGGVEFQGELSASVIKNSVGKTLGLVVIAKNITERKLLQEKLLNSEKLAALGHLAASVGHDIRNPLGVIKNSAYFLNMKLKAVPDKKVHKHLKILEKEVNRANLIANDLLDFASQNRLTFEKADLNDIIKSALANIPIPENVDATIEIGAIPRMLLNKEKMLRVFQNLALNAVQAMPNGGKLIVKASKHENSVKISFIDTGTGIAKENLQGLFAPLFTTKSKGVGLGLSICMKIVKAHGGDITVASNEGKGTTFTIRLPTRPKKDLSGELEFNVKSLLQTGVKTGKQYKLSDREAFQNSGKSKL